MIRDQGWRDSGVCSNELTSIILFTFSLLGSLVPSEVNLLKAQHKGGVAGVQLNLWEVIWQHALSGDTGSIHPFSFYIPVTLRWTPSLGLIFSSQSTVPIQVAGEWSSEITIRKNIPLSCLLKVISYSHRNITQYPELNNKKYQIYGTCIFTTKLKYVPCFLLLYILLLYFSQFQMCFDQVVIWATVSIQEK